MHQVDKPRPAEEGRWVYLLPSSGAGTERSIRLTDVIATLCAGWLWIALAASSGAAAGVVYAIRATPWYRAEVVLTPPDHKSIQSGLAQLGGLAGLAGISLPGDDSGEQLALLQSRELAKEFIERHDLMPILMADQWDAKGGKWRESDKDKQPDIRDAVGYFRESVLKVHEESRSAGIVTLVVEWKDPVQASEWASQFVRDFNENARNRVLRESQKRVELLQKELRDASLLPLQQAISRLLESELQQLVLARSVDEYALKTVDSATPPRRPYRPRRMLTVLLLGLVGFAVGASLVLLVKRRNWLTGDV